MSIGKNIKFYRKKKGLTQKKLADLTGLAEITIRQYESEKYEPKRENLYKIRKVLDVNLNQLLGSISDIPDECDYDLYDDNIYVQKNIIWDDRTLKLLNKLDKINDLSEEEKQQYDHTFNHFGSFPKSYSEFLIEVDEEAKKDFFSLLYRVGYEITEMENGDYEVTANRGGFINATKEELKTLEANIMNFISYTVDKFYDEKRDEKFKK